MSKTPVAAAVAIAAAFVIPAAILAQQGTDQALARALEEAALPLERGIAASAREGVPISAKYEFDDDDRDELQLSVYTMKGAAAGDVAIDYETGDVSGGGKGAFAEVIVDHKTGAIGKVVAISGGEDLKAASRQGEAMARASRSLEAATAHAVAANGGYRAVSATPAVRDGHPVAEVVLTDGTQWKTVVERLD